MIDSMALAGSRSRLRQRVVYALMAASLLLLTLALYWPVTGNDFIAYDDPDYVTSNPQVRDGLTWAGVKAAFSTPTSCNWHPLTMLSHMLDCQMFGMKPWGHHLTSLLLHGINVMLIFMLLRQITGATWRSLWVAALFAVHPLRVESVAWVAERKDVLSSLFGLLGLILYARYAQSQGQRPTPINRERESKVQSRETEARSRERKVERLNSRDRQSRTTPSRLRLTPHTSRFYLGSLLCYGLSLMSKAMLVTWPFVMLLLDYWPWSGSRTPASGA